MRFCLSEKYGIFWADGQHNFSRRNLLHGICYVFMKVNIPYWDVSKEKQLRWLLCTSHNVVATSGEKIGPIVWKYWHRIRIEFAGMYSSKNVEFVGLHITVGIILIMRWHSFRCLLSYTVDKSELLFSWLLPCRLCQSVRTHQKMPLIMIMPKSNIWAGLLCIRVLCFSTRFKVT
jgi:hypothetical protein